MATKKKTKKYPTKKAKSDALKKLKKKVTTHLKEDMKGYKHEYKEDADLIKNMKKKKK
jgi:hypothetical protein